MYRPKCAVLAFLLLLSILVLSQAEGSTGNRLKMIASDQAFIKLLSTVAFLPSRQVTPDTKPKYQLITIKIPAQGPAKAIIKESRSNQIYYLGVSDQLRLTKVEKIDANQVSLNLEGKLIF